MPNRPAPALSAPTLRRARLTLLAVVGTIAASLILSACGGSTPASGAADKERSKEQTAEAKLADFARCMREHGVNAEAISHPGGGQGLRVSPGSGGSQQPEVAEKACGRYRPEPRHVNLSPQQKVEHEEAVQKFAKCMREHGVKVEASAQGGGIQIRIHSHPGAEGAPNPESPAFQSAQKDCQGLLPGGGPRTLGPGQSRASGSEGSGSPAPQSQAGG